MGQTRSLGACHMTLQKVNLIVHSHSNSLIKKHLIQQGSIYLKMVSVIYDKVWSSNIVQHL